jgi:hypothetical protein
MSIRKLILRILLVSLALIWFESFNNSSFESVWLTALAAGSVAIS